MNRKISLLIVAFWPTIGLIYLLSLNIDGAFALSFRNIAVFVCAYGSWSLLTLALLRVLRGPIVERRFGTAAVFFVFAYVVWLPLFTLLDGATAWLANGRSVVDHLLNVRATYVFFHTVLYIVVFVTCAVLIYYSHSQRMERAAAEFERKNTQAELSLVTWQLRSLQSQLSPHLLFNALNSLSGMARVRQDTEMVTALARLGDMLRFALETSERSLITVSEEIEFTHHYVSMQRLRFGERYRFELDHEAPLKSEECPPFVLQSLVENAFTHAVDGSDEVVTIQAGIHRDATHLEFRVSNTRTAPSDERGGLGLALNNLKERLQLLYGDTCKVVADESHGRYTASVRIPVRRDD